MKLPFFCVVFFLPFQHAAAQLVAVPAAVKKILVKNCPVCQTRPANMPVYSSSFKGYSRCDIDYHNCHCFYNSNQMDSAYSYALQVLGRQYCATDTNRIGIALYIKDKVLLHKQLYNEALPDLLALIRKPSFDTVLKANIYPNIGEIYLIREDYTDALQYLMAWLTNFTSTDVYALRNVYINIASCYVGTNKPSEAKKYFAKSIAVSEQLRDTFGIATSYINMANQYYNQYQDKLATDYFKKGLQLALQTHDDKLKQTAVLNMAIVSENKKAYKTALRYRKAYEQLYDSIYNRDNVWQLAQEEKKLAKQESDHRMRLVEQQNKLMEQRAQLQSLMLNKRNFQLGASVVLAVVFLSFFAFAFSAYHTKSRQNKIISAQREELDELNHTKDQLFSVVAHDLRSPAQTLKAVLSRLRTALSDKDISKAEQVSGEIETISNSTYSLLNNLLYWALSQTGQLHFTSDPLNINRLVEQVYYDYRPVAAAKNIVLQNYVPESVFCRGDLNTIKIIFRNLIDNAIKFSDPYSDIIITAVESSSDCLIAVKDSGKGIDASIVQALANNNKRLTTDHSHLQSTGIGLWLVKTMAERNGGSLQIQKETKGTTVTIYLPLYITHEQTENTYR